MPFELLIRNGICMTPAGPARVDIGVRTGRIAAIGDLAVRSADEVFDATGLHVLPGVIDSQVHFREPGAPHKEDFDSGTRGAILGGVTAAFDMPNTRPLTIDRETFADKLDRAQGRAWCDYAFFIGGCAANADRLAELERLPGCAGIKVFMGSSTGDLLAADDATLSRILQAGVRRVTVHAEDEARLQSRRAIVERSGDVGDHPRWRDVETALRATRRILVLAARARRPLHVLHVTTAEEMALLARHKHIATVEVLPQHLTLAAPDCYRALGTLAQMNPPIRDLPHQQALWQALAAGVVDTLGSDHAPHTLAEKALAYPASPSGMPGVQTLLPLMLDHVTRGRLSLARLVELTSAGPARVFGVAGKGALAIGFDADFSIVDLNARCTLRSDDMATRAGWTPFDGRTVCGWPMATVIRGRVVMRDGEVLGPASGAPVRFRSPDGEHGLHEIIGAGFRT
ncbi:dihydroorotase [Jeongeupia chitinilytica]|uniref:Dihydroorotase n=1 Tax=Jeongeupia chitinilytica TaxID=1041641 RepID=A0ABQ3GYM6_9NEIS|nr:dihydroorotase [Jeongeupia chitinilytica]GHD58850.1 dihydroorotase [Jeongeupia chitinilytica]